MKKPGEPLYPDDEIPEPEHKGRGALSNASSRYDEEKKIRTTDGWDIEDELPPSLFEANGGSKMKDKDDKKPKRDEPAPVATKAIAPVKAALCVTTGTAKLGSAKPRYSGRHLQRGPGSPG